ncbi:MAG TPA: SDR family oxidoreductase [Thermodesulfobacteriota bacterium]
MDLGLKGKVAVVAGASKGMGRAIARGLAAEGAAVALLARDRATLERAASDIAEATGSSTLAVPTDVTRRDQIERAIAATVERFGRLDILVTNGGGPPPGTFETATDEQWQAAFELNLLSTVRMIRAALPHLARSGAGRIVNVQSTSIKQPIPGLMLSNGIRPGVQGLARTLAEEIARKGITINTVCPGRIKTDRFESLLANRMKAWGVSREEALRREEETIPMGYAGEPEDVAHVVVFLCSEKARYVTGQSIAVDGGITRGSY